MNDGYGPLIPMPELTPDALRAAVARIAPSRLPALTQHLFEAATNAQQTQSLAPLHAFAHSWAVFIAIEQHPHRAARLHELERIVDAGTRSRPRPWPRSARSGRRPRPRRRRNGTWLSGPPEW
ncbi:MULTISPECIES: hypothetical protein [unclassified Streptomyces]|uniref:hypothetical protein n=1 Tax=unclassified Streptomyces TaxID=2593676 RepID=UPI0021B0BB51|nr:MULTISPECIES: hypothetical protein [unclassified Streptomyces]